MSAGERVTLRSGVSLSYGQRHAGGSGNVVLIPGPTDSWRSYEPVLDRLPVSLRAVAVSLRGHAGSDKPESGYAVEDLAEDVVQLLDALEMERVVLVGHSGSCMVVRRVAIDHPERVAGIVLEASPTTLRDDAAFNAFFESTVSSLADPIDPEFVRAFVTDTSSDLAPEALEPLVVDALEVPARVWKAVFSGLQRYDDTTELSRVEAPTLLVWGDADPLVSREMQDELVALLPETELLVYRGSGHTPRWDEPERFSTDLGAFVEAVTRRGSSRREG